MTDMTIERMINKFRITATLDGDMKSYHFHEATPSEAKFIKSHKAEIIALIWRRAEETDALSRNSIEIDGVFCDLREGPEAARASARRTNPNVNPDRVAEKVAEEISRRARKATTAAADAEAAEAYDRDRAALRAHWMRSGGEDGDL
ncbi:MAG: hypothetical protein LBJ44_08495 [Propionibacteriaceae bacterium]|jgi:hypothetical protein|nr:hypothetical protein [Propionibacteriaceae bacterium]